MHHPAYPPRAALIAERTAADAATIVHARNGAVALILGQALQTIRDMDLDDRDTPCMAPGWDWASIQTTLGDMLPKADDPVERRKVAAHLAGVAL